MPTRCAGLVQTGLHLIVFGVDQSWLERTVYRIRGEYLTITPPIRILKRGIKLALMFNKLFDEQSETHSYSNVCVGAFLLSVCYIALVCIILMTMWSDI
jgi:hypothetical protein